MEAVNSDIKNIQPIYLLLVEDNEDDIEITLRAFKKADININISVVNDGQATLDFLYNRTPYEDKATHPRPNVILLDINMPKLSGFDVLDQLKKDPDYKTIPVVILTSSKNEEDIVKSYNGGASSYIKKPVKYEDFENVTKTFLDYWKNINVFPKQ